MDRGWMMDGQPLDLNNSLEFTIKTYRVNGYYQQIIWDDVRLCGGCGGGGGRWVGRPPPSTFPPSPLPLLPALPAPP